MSSEKFVLNLSPSVTKTDSEKKKTPLNLRLGSNLNQSNF